MASIAQMMDMQGRVALITGAAGHLGSAMAEALAEAGAAIALVDFDAAKNEEVAARIRREHDVDTLAIEADLENEAQVKSICPRVLDHFDRLDVLINCAALVGTSALKGWAVPFAEQNVETWRRALEVNLTAPFVLAQSCAEALAAHGKGSIINIGSIYGVSGPDLRLYEDASMGNPAAYAASKGGLTQLTRWLSTVMAPDVRVNTITVGGVWRQQPESFHTRYVARTPLGRMAREDDLKGAALYLASDLSAYVTGQNLVVDGGWTAW